MTIRYLEPWGAMLLLGSWLAFHVVHVCSFLALRAFQTVHVLLTLYKGTGDPIPKTRTPKTLNPKPHIPKTLTPKP